MIRPVLVASFVMVACADLAGAAVEEIVLLYNERPPYLVSRDGQRVAGLTGSPAEDAFRAAGLPFKWVKVPTNRQLAMLKENEGPVCAVGWFKNAEREAYARYSKPIYQDRPTVAIAHASFVPSASRLADALQSPSARVLVKDGFSYGPYVDQLLKQCPQSRLVTAAENVDMLKMVAAQRADFMFAAAEEAEHLLQQAGAAAVNRLKVIRFDDVPVGERRYILCSRQVGAQVMERVNAGIRHE